MQISAQGSFILLPPAMSLALPGTPFLLPEQNNTNLHILVRGRRNFGPSTRFGADAALCFIGWVRPNPVPPVLALITCIDTHKLGQFVHKLGSIIMLIGTVWLCWECLQSATVLWDSAARKLLPLKRLELLQDPTGAGTAPQRPKPSLNNWGEGVRRAGVICFLWNAGFCSLVPKYHILSSPWCTKHIKLQVAAERGC